MLSKRPITIEQALKGFIRKEYVLWNCVAHVAIAAAMNVVQLTHWLSGEAAEQTRTSPFKRVMKQAA
jgi:hypothetical protein